MQNLVRDGQQRKQVPQILNEVPEKISEISESESSKSLSSCDSDDDQDQILGKNPKII